jgi:dolichol-phosphate mannosyltransferase
MEGRVLQAGKSRVTVVIPTYNERESLPLLVPKLVELANVEMIVVDDASPDGTAEIADQLARRHPGRIEVLRRAGPRGLGLSYIDGLRRALEHGPEVVVQMDADLSHDPQYLPEMIAAADAHDLVIGSRYVRGVSVVNWPLRRLVLSAFANAFVRSITRLPVKDCTSGFRCWRAAALARLPFERVRSEGYAHLVETLYLAWRGGCRLAEVPIIFVERRQGVSKLDPKVLLESFWMPLRLRLRELGR